MKLNSKDILLFSGDSITHGGRGEKMDCNHIFGHGYQYTVASQLALENCAERPKFINKAYSGYTMDNLLDKWQDDVIANKPTILSILCGTNDCTQGYLKGYTVEETAERYRNNLVKAIHLTKEAVPELKVIILEPFYYPLDRTELTYDYTPHPYCEPPFARPDRDDTEELINFRLSAMELCQKAAKEVAESENAVFVPLNECFLEEMSRTRREYFMWDGTHPTIAGHALIAREWMKAVK